MADRNHHHLIMRFNSLNSNCWFPVAPRVHGLQSVQSTRLAVPREGKTGRRPPKDFEQSQLFGVAPYSAGARGGGQGSFLRGFREEPGNPASRISMGLWVVGLESDPFPQTVYCWGLQFYLKMCPPCVRSCVRLPGLCISHHLSPMSCVRGCVCLPGLCVSHHLSPMSCVRGCVCLPGLCVSHHLSPVICLPLFVSPFPESRLSAGFF